MMEKNSPMGSEARQHSCTITDLVERAFKYRGDVTVEIAGDKSVSGYLFNRNAHCEEPFAQLFETETGRDITVSYQSITHIRFTGRDAAAASVRHFEDFRRQ